MLFEGNLAYLEGLYRAWREDPATVDPAWASWMQSLEEGRAEEPPAWVPARPPASAPPAGRRRAGPRPPPEARRAAWRTCCRPTAKSATSTRASTPCCRAASRGPTTCTRGPRAPTGSSPWAPTASRRRTWTRSWPRWATSRRGRAPLRRILQDLEQTYCGSVGVEVLHIQNRPIRNWLLRRMESTRNRTPLDPRGRRRVLETLIRAEEFERFLHRTFIGQKRFSLEGAEVLIPALQFLLDAAAGRAAWRRWCWAPPTGAASPSSTRWPDSRRRRSSTCSRTCTLLGSTAAAGT